MKVLRLVNTSLPSRERGLKCSRFKLTGELNESLPSRERGLKYLRGRTDQLQRVVAPFAGAWIEILSEMQRHGIARVAPFAGAWIEMH